MQTPKICTVCVLLFRYARFAPSLHSFPTSPRRHINKCKLCSLKRLVFALVLVQNKTHGHFNLLHMIWNQAVMKERSVSLITTGQTLSGPLKYEHQENKPRLERSCLMPAWVSRRSGTGLYNHRTSAHIPAVWRPSSTRVNARSMQQDP